VRRRALAIALAVFALGGVAAPAFAVTAQQIYRETRCPTCNTPLDVSTSPAAQAIKDFIQVRIAKGQSEEQILAALEAEFGREVLATPPKEGFDLVAWIVPIVLVVGGLCAIPLVTRSWARRRHSDTPAPEISPEDAARLDDELKNHPG
jgi:cytochrome c-type biogenesis protein CcmH